MKKKLLFALTLTLVTCMLAFTFTACSTPHSHTFSQDWSSDASYHYHQCTGCSAKQDVEEHSWGNGVLTTRPSKLNSGTRTYSCSICKREKTETVPFVAPTGAQAYAARQKVVEEQFEGYDFSFQLNGNLSVLGLGVSVEGLYEGQYRLNKTTNEETFKKVSSGELFFDETSYSYTKNSQKIKLVADETGMIKKSSVIRTQDESAFFINKVIVNLVNTIQASTFNNIEVIDSTAVPYDFYSTLNFGANTTYLSKITSLFSNFGTKVAFKNVEFTNPTAIPFFFSLDENNRLEDFCIGFIISIEVKAVTVDISISYTQQGASSQIYIPTSNDLLVSDTQIQSELTKINNALNVVKNSGTYSLDLVARNEFDPSWNKLAIVDQYKARLYKNTVDSNVWFNHSYEYKAHHEEDGAEKYEYTLGNITDGSVYLVSRKGKNTISAVNNISVTSQFDYLTNPFIFTVDNIDCIKKVVNGNNTEYTLHLNNQSAIAVQDKIVDIVNSNDAEGVLDVDNYLNQIINIKDAEFVVVFENDMLKSISLKTDLKYNPTAGDYTDYNITLTNKLELLINENLEGAQEYEAPDSPEKKTLGVITGGLAYAKYHIL